MSEIHIEEIRRLADKLNLHEEIVATLYKRGYTDYQSLREYLLPSNNFTPAISLRGMAEAVERIKSAIEKKEKLLIFGDYDCDGICATSILQLYFNSIEADCVHYIPRRSDGYGLSVTAIEKVIEEHMPDLIITVDCGISAAEEVEYCLDLGVDIIVTDHHEPQEILPDCIIVNPKLTPDSPMHDICGAAVAMKLVEGLAGREISDTYIDLACLASVADVVPLVGENRAIVYHGLKQINTFSRTGLKLLCASCELKCVTAMDIGFRLAPRINAIGRMDYNDDLVDLFTSEDPFEIKILIENINEANAKRQQITKDLFEECKSMLSAADLREKHVIVLSNPKWEAGILGLVAAKLCTTYYRPVVLLGKGSDGLRGSARSIAGVNIFECLSECSSLLMGFGGHERAAGLSISPENIKAFAALLDRTITDRYPSSLFVPKLYSDIELTKSICKIAFAKQLELLEPTGEGNPAPKLSVMYSDCKFSRIGNSAHLKGRLNSETDIVAFSRDYLLKAGNVGADFKLYVEASIKVFNNREYVQLSVCDEEPENVSTFADNSPSFANYLKTALFPPSKDTYIRFSDENTETELTSIYGTMFVAYSCETAKRFYSVLEQKGKKDMVPVLSAGVCPENPLNTLLISPMDFSCFSKFSSVVFLDAPLSTGILAQISQKAPEPELVLVKAYGFEGVFLSLELSAQGLLYTAERLSAFIKTGEKADGINDLFFRLLSYGYKYSNESFTLHFYALYDIGWLKVCGGFSLVCFSTKPDITNSKVIRIAQRMKDFFLERR